MKTILTLITALMLAGCGDTWYNPDTATSEELHRNGCDTPPGCGDGYNVIGSPGQ